MKTRNIFVKIGFNMLSQRTARNVGHQNLSLPKVLPWGEGKVKRDFEILGDFHEICSLEVK